MVRFKTIKYKHYRKARQLTAREDAGEDVEEEYLSFALSMVAEWDFVDEETGSSLPVGAKSLDELSLGQMVEVSTLFNRKFGDMSSVPKASAEPSLSISMPSSQNENQGTLQSGSQSSFSPES